MGFLGVENPFFLVTNVEGVLKPSMWYLNISSSEFAMRLQIIRICALGLLNNKCILNTHI